MTSLIAASLINGFTVTLVRRSITAVTEMVTFLDHQAAGHRREPLAGWKEWRRRQSDKKGEGTPLASSRLFNICPRL